MNGKLRMIAAMLIFGSIGVFVKEINLPSSEIAFFRGVIGSLFLIIVSFFVKQKFSLKEVKKNFVLLILSGAAIGFNWIFLFEAYRYTTVSNATLSYYFAPIFVMLLAPVVLREKLTMIKIACILAAMAGMILVVGGGGSSQAGSYHPSLGIFYGLLAAVLYASAILMNKFIKNLIGFELTLIQLMAAAMVLLPYVYFRDHFAIAGLNTKAIIFIFVLGIIHTGAAYFLYFTSIKELKGQTIAVLSYIDPISAVIFAAVFLGEKMTLLQGIGGVLILGSTFLSEILDKKANNKIE